MKRLLLIALIAFAVTDVFAQYDPDLLPPQFFKGNRERLLAQMPDSSFALFFSNDERNRNNDVEFLYRQENGLYYLTGHTEQDAVLFLSKSPITIDGKATNEILFVQKREPAAEIWTGRRLGAEGAVAKLGIALAKTTDEYKDFLKTTILQNYRDQYKSIFLLQSRNRRTNEIFSNVPVALKEISVLADSSKLSVQSSAPILAQMRLVKQPIEIAMIRKATDISLVAHEEAMKSCEPNMYEYEVAAVAEYVFKKKGCEYTGYPSIVGAGENSVILHYNTNRKKMLSGELLVMDMSGEYHGYTSDITRTIPVNGTFSSEQKAIYDLVRVAQDSAIRQCLNGKSFTAPHQASSEVIADGLLKLGVITNREEYRKYFMHGTSHNVGLDVHDPGFGKIVTNQIFTVEPGIYISEGSPCDKKWWNIGVRIEDVVLVTENGFEVLSAALPRQTEEIEAVMKKKGIGNSELKELTRK